MEWYSATCKVLDFKSKERALDTVIAIKSELDTLDEIKQLLREVAANYSRKAVTDFNRVVKIAFLTYKKNEDGSMRVDRKVNANDLKEKDQVDQWAKPLRKVGDTHIMMPDGSVLEGNADDYGANARRNLMLLIEKGDFRMSHEFDDPTQELIKAVRFGSKVYTARDEIHEAQIGIHAEARNLASAVLAERKRIANEKKAAAETTPVAEQTAEGKELAKQIKDAAKSQKGKGKKKAAELTEAAELNAEQEGA
jgi:hypothetical protein